jgi:hypothetical protein
VVIKYGALKMAYETPGSPTSVHCQVILSKGLDQNTCLDFRKVRAYVMCLAWDKMAKEKLQFRDAIRRSWEVTRDMCTRLGGA